MAKEIHEIERISSLVPDRIEKIVDAEPICVLRHSVGIEKIQQLIEIELTKLAALMNVANNMQPHQMVFTSERIIETYPAESVDLFILAFRRGASGYYGSTFHQLDTSIVMGWIQKTIEDKSYYTERDNQTAKEHEKNQAVDYEAFKARIEKKRIEQLVER